MFFKWACFLHICMAVFISNWKNLQFISGILHFARHAHKSNDITNVSRKVTELDCVRERPGCAIKVEAVHWGSQTYRWSKGWDICISPHCTRAPARVTPAETEGHCWVTAGFCELRPSSLIWPSALQAPPLPTVYTQLRASGIEGTETKWPENLMATFSLENDLDCTVCLCGCVFIKGLAPKRGTLLFYSLALNSTGSHLLSIVLTSCFPHSRRTLTDLGSSTQGVAYDFFSMPW